MTNANIISHVHGLIVMRRSTVEAVLKEPTDINNFDPWKSRAQYCATAIRGKE